MARYDGSIRIDTRVDSKGFNSGLKTISSGLSGVVKALKGIAVAAGVAFSIKAAVDFGKASVKAASELSNALMGLQSIMEGQGRSFQKAKGFIEEYTSDGLISATEAINAYKNLALRGYDDSQIQAVLIALKDSAAFGRQASYTLGAAVETATEGLKNENSILVDNAGVTKNVAKMWDDYAKSIGTTSNNLTTQQKIQAEVTGILEETKYQTGDAAKIANSYSGQVLQLGFAFNNLKVAVGNALMPILQQIIPVIKTVVDWFTKLANIIGQVTAALFGKVVNTNAAITSGADEAATATSGLADAEKEAGNAAEKAGKQAKGALAAFDELNVLQQSTGSEEAAGVAEEAPISGGGINIEEVGGIDENSELSETLDRLKEKLQPVIDAFGRLWDEIKKIGDFAWQGLQDFYEHFLKPVGEWAFGEDSGLTKFVNIIADGLSMIDWGKINEALIALWDALAPFAINVGDGLLWFLENALVPLAVWAMNNVVPLAIEGLAAAVEVLNNILKALEPLGKWLWEKFLKPLAEWTGDVVVEALSQVVDGLRDFADWISENEEVVQTIAVIVGAFAAAWGLVNAAMAIWNVIGVVATAVTGAFGAAVAFLTSPIGLIVLAIGALIAIIVLLVKHWDTVKEKAGEVWQSIKDTWETVSDWFSEKVLEPLEKAFKGTVNFLIGLAEGMANKWINAINFIIKALNKIQFDIPDWVPVIGGKTFGINIPELEEIKLPRLATGAVIPPNQQFMAILGDQKSGRNLEAPEGLIRQIMREELAGLNTGTDVTINFEGNLAQLARVLNPAITKEQKRIGASLKVGGVTV